MNIYLVERTDEVDYDNYDRLVVTAESEEAARRVTPPGETWTTDVATVKVTWVGSAAGERADMSRIVLGSFRAG